MGAATAPVCVNTVPGGTGTSVTPTLPSGHALNDIVYIFVGNTGNVTWTAPAGWSIRLQSTIGAASTGLVGTLLYHKVVAADSLPLASPVCSLGATVTRFAISWNVRGADLEGVHALAEWSASGQATGTANPVRPPSVTSQAPNMLAVHYYAARTATNAPDPSGYTQLTNGEVVISGTIVGNVAIQTIPDPDTTLSNQDVSPTSGARWVGGIMLIPAPDYVYYRAGSQALTASGTAATPTLPAGTSASDWRGNKDLVVATVEAAGVIPTPQVPSDWTPITDWLNNTSGGATTIRKWWALGTPNTQFNRPTTGEIAVCLTTYRNTRQTNPIANADARPIASGTTSTWEARQRRNADSTVTFSCVADGTPTFTPPAGVTERMDGNGIVCADRSYGASGQTASGAFTLSAASPSLVGSVEIISVTQPFSPVLPNTHKSVKAESGISTGERIR